MADVLPGPSNSPAVVSRPGQRDRLVGRRSSGPAADASRPAAVLRAARRTAAAGLGGAGLVAGPAAWRLPGPAQPDRAGSGDVHRPSPAHRRVYAAAGCAGPTEGFARGAGGRGYAFHGQVKRCWLRQVRPGGLAALGAPAPSVLFDPPAPPAWLDLPMAQVASLRAISAPICVIRGMPAGSGTTTPRRRRSPRRPCWPDAAARHRSPPMPRGSGNTRCRCSVPAGPPGRRPTSRRAAGIRGIPASAAG